MPIVFISLAALLVAVLILRMTDKRRTSNVKNKKSIGKAEGSKARLPDGLIDYNQYSLSKVEKMKYILMAVAFLLAVGYIFFKNFWLCLILCLFAFLYPKIKKKDLVKKRKDELNLQFKDALNSISSSLSAGKSVEGAFKAAIGDLQILYSGQDAFIIKELDQINRKLEMNQTIEDVLQEFAMRADMEDITNFADVFIICKNTGGNLVEVIKNTSKVINQKIEIKNEIDVLIAEQKFSQKILSVMPFILLIAIMSSSPDYIAPLYSAKGHLVMIIVLVLLGISYLIGRKIVDIKV